MDLLGIRPFGLSSCLPPLDKDAFILDRSNPFRKAPLIRRIALPLVVIAIGLGWVCFKVLSSRPGVFPSSFFRQLDRDHNGTVAFSEWKNYHEQRMGWAGLEWDFHFMDCNNDQRLTWWEYRAWTFRRQSCGKPMNIADRPQSPGTVSFCETDPVNHIQTCYLGSRGRNGELTWPSAGPMKRLEIPQ